MTYQPTLLASASETREMTRAFRRLPILRDVAPKERLTLAEMNARCWRSASEAYLVLSKRAMKMGCLGDAKRFARAYGAAERRAEMWKRASICD
jgi:hypothetical protein